jgi:hypothetical protein
MANGHSEQLQSAPPAPDFSVILAGEKLTLLAHALSP